MLFAKGVIWFATLLVVWAIVCLIYVVLGVWGLVAFGFILLLGWAIDRVARGDEDEQS